MMQSVQLDMKDSFYFHLHHMVYEYERARKGGLFETVSPSNAVAEGGMPLDPCSKTSSIEGLTSTGGDIHAGAANRKPIKDIERHNKSMCMQSGDIDGPETVDEEIVKDHLHHEILPNEQSLTANSAIKKIQPASEYSKVMFGKLASARTGIITATSAFQMLQGIGSTTDYNTLVQTLQQVELWRGGCGHPCEVDDDGIPNIHIHCTMFAKIMEADFSDFNDVTRSCIEELREAFEISSQRNRAAAKSLTKEEWIVILLDVVPIVVISLNALVIGYSADFHPGSIVWIILEAAFTLFFTVEAAVRWRITGSANYFCGEEMGWNLFDLVCLACAYGDLLLTLGSSLANGAVYKDLDGVMLVKMLRLVRVCRVLRTMRFGAVRELRVIIEGIFAGMNVLFWAISLLIFTVYVIGISARMVIEDVPEFANVSASLTTTFRCFTDGCSTLAGTSLVEGLRLKYGEFGIVFSLIYMGIFLFVVFGIFNLIMAVFLDQVLNQHIASELRDLGIRHGEMEDMIANVIGNLASGKTRQREESSRSSIWSLSYLMGCEKRRAAKEIKNNRLSKAVMVQLEGNDLVCRDDFNAWLEKPEMIELLQECKIETATKYELFDVLDADLSGELQFGELVDGLMSLRGPITKSDVVSINLKCTRLIQQLDDMHRKICGAEKAEDERN